MSSPLKLSLTLILTFLLLAGCMQVPDDLPPLARHVNAEAAAPA